MDKAKQWVALAVAAALALLTGGWFVLVQPQRAEAALLQEQAAAQQVQNAQLETQLEVLRGKAAGLPAQEKALAEVAAQIPDDPELPQLLRALTAAGRAAGVELTAVTPSAAVPLAAEAAGATNDPASAAGAGGGLSSVVLTMRAAGDYYELEQFVAGLEDLPRVLRVTGLMIAEAEDSGGRALTATITAAVYVSAGPAPAAAPAAGADPAAPAGGTDPAAPAGGTDPAAPAEGTDPAAPAPTTVGPATTDATAPVG